MTSGKLIIHHLEIFLNIEIEYMVHIYTVDSIQTRRVSFHSVLLQFECDLCLYAVEGKKKKLFSQKMKIIFHGVAFWRNFQLA